MKENAETSRIARRMAAIGGLALVVGLGFNAVIPLGVRAANHSAKGTTAPAAAAHPAGPAPVYENETLSLSLETEAAAAAAGPAAANPVPTVPTLTWPGTSKLLAAGQIVLV